MFRHLTRKLMLWIKGDKRAKWPKSIFDLEQCIYPYFLQAFEMKPEEYEKARDILDACLEDAFSRLKGNGPKVELNHNNQE